MLGLWYMEQSVGDLLRGLKRPAFSSDGSIKFGIIPIQLCQ